MKTVYVVSFEPNPDGPAGVGGFEWRITKEAILEELQAMQSNSPEGHYIFHTFEMEIDLKENITLQVERFLYEMDLSGKSLLELLDIFAKRINAVDDSDREQTTKDTWHDYVVAHGFGEPTEEGYALMDTLIKKHENDVATAAFEVVSRGLTTDPEV